MIFLHGSPGIGLMWRAQLEAFASEGWRCVAPDMRGYGGSSAPAASDAFAISQIVGDMVELHDHLGGKPAIWVGHDQGSPVAGALASHHPDRPPGARSGLGALFPRRLSRLPSLLPLIDRQLYPTDQYPEGQWDYYRFYLTHFDQSGERLRRRYPLQPRGNLSARQSSDDRSGLSIRQDHRRRRMVRLGTPRPARHARPARSGLRPTSTPWWQRSRPRDFVRAMPGI